MSKISEYHEPI